MYVLVKKPWRTFIYKRLRACTLYIIVSLSEYECKRPATDIGRATVSVNASYVRVSCKNEFAYPDGKTTKYYRCYLIYQNKRAAIGLHEYIKDRKARIICGRKYIVFSREQTQQFDCRFTWSNYFLNIWMPSSVRTTNWKNLCYIFCIRSRIYNIFLIQCN
jgi:hypothetical protein